MLLIIKPINPLNNANKIAGPGNRHNTEAIPPKMIETIPKCLIIFSTIFKLNVFDEI